MTFHKILKVLLSVFALGYKDFTFFEKVKGPVPEIDANRILIHIRELTY